MTKRVVSAIVVIALVTILMISGGWVMLTGLMLLSIGGMVEIFRLKIDTKGKKEGRKAFVIMTVTGSVAVVIWFVMLQLNSIGLLTAMDLILFLAILALVLMSEVVFLYPVITYREMALLLFAFIYVAGLFGIFYVIRRCDNGGFYVWFIFAVAWGSDTCAFFTGLSLGRHRMSPVLSPNKTVEGAIGGVVGAIVLCLILGVSTSSVTRIDLGVMIKYSLVVGLLGGVIAEVGDLFASSIKRAEGVKDFGNLIPGHGGILDRFDSTLMVAPVVLLLLKAFRMV